MSSVPNVIHFNCQSCGMLLTVPKEFAGVTGPCPHCRATITSPAASFETAHPGPSWPMAQNAASAPAVPIPPAHPAASSLPLPQPPPPPPSAQPVARTPLPPPAGAEGSASSPKSAWEASNPPQASPLPPAVGGGVMNPVWPPTGTELPAPSLPGPPGSAHPVMESVLQMPGVHQPTGQPLPLPQGQMSPSFPPAPPPRTSPLAPPGGNGGAQRFKSSRNASSSRKGPAVLALLMALMVLAGIAWFFRDQIRVAWMTHTMAKEAEADALEFHPTPPEPDEPATPPGTFDPAGAPPKTAPSPTPGPVPVAAVGGDGAPTTTPAPAPALPPSPGAGTDPAPTPAPPEQIQRPAMAATPSDAEPTPTAPEPAPNPGPSATPNLVEVPSAARPPDSGPAPQGTGTPIPGVPPSSSKRPPSPAPPAVVENVPEESRPALESLKQFLAASTWEERLKVVQGADLMKPLMESYYASMPDGPLRVTKIALLRYDRAPQTGPPHCVFQIGGGDLKRPLPIMVEQSPEGWRVDWLTFTEFKDNLLARFMESPQEGPKRFHVMVRRTHYFDDNVPEVDKKICVEVQSPTPPFVGSVFAKRGTPVANILDRYLGWEVDQAAAVVELEWRREGDQQWVELTSLPQFNWRNAIAGEVIPPPQAAPTTPVAVPVRD